MGFKVPRQAFESHQGFNAGAVTPLLLMRVFHPPAYGAPEIGVQQSSWHPQRAVEIL